MTFPCDYPYLVVVAEDAHHRRNRRLSIRQSKLAMLTASRGNQIGSACLQTSAERKEAAAAAVETDDERKEVAAAAVETDELVLAGGGDTEEEARSSERTHERLPASPTAGSGTDLRETTQMTGWEMRHCWHILDSEKEMDVGMVNLWKGQSSEEEVGRTGFEKDLMTKARLPQNLKAPLENALEVDP